MKIPVVRRVSKTDFEIAMIEISDVLYTYVQDGTLMYQTREETFGQITTLEEQERFLSQNGFCKVERGYLVQMEKVHYFDEERSCLFFEPYPASKSAPNAPVSRARRKEIDQWCTTGQPEQTTRINLARG